MRFVNYGQMLRSFTRDEENFQESKHSRATNGQFGSGGGGSSSSGGGGVDKHVATVNKVISTPVKGNSPERVEMRALLKNNATPFGLRTPLKHKVIESFEKQYNDLAKKGNPKAEGIKVKLMEYSAKYGVPPKTIAQANEGYSPYVQAQAQAIMKAELPKPDLATQLEQALASPSAITYTPQETADFNDLVAIGGQAAKGWTHHAKQKVSSLGLNMSVGECAHIIAYSGNAYRETNASLRAGVMTKARWKHVKALNNALDKLPAHRGVVYRKANLNTAAASLYEVGSIVEERGFTSSAKSQGVWSGDYHYEIESRTGRDISHISSSPGEKEVLFKSGTRFEVVSKSGTKIKLKEVE